MIEDINREDIYKREELTHNDETFDIKREEQVNIFYKKPSFDKIFNCAFSYMGDITGKKILEYGCGNGENIQHFISEGAFYTGFDISLLRINRALKLIDELNVKDRANVEVMNAEKITFPDNSFDIIYAQAIIHHLDIETALKDIKRLLKNQGTAIFIEPRGNNPLINYFRKKSPDLRTVDEHPLIIEDYKLFKKYFNVQESNFYFISILSLLIRKYIKSEILYLITKNIFDFVDSLIFNIIPYSRRFAWYSVIRLK